MISHDNLITNPPPLVNLQKGEFIIFLDTFYRGCIINRKDVMKLARKYDKNFKSMIVNLIVNEKHSTLKTAEQFDIPLKTVEKWITAYNKDNRCFDADYKTQAQVIDDLKKENASLRRDNDILKKTISLLAKKE